MNIIYNAMFMITLSLVVIKEYEVIQNYHYELRKYFLHLINNKKKYIYFLYFLLGTFLFRFDFLYFLLSLLLLTYLIRHESKLKYTKRVKRVLVINFILLSVFLITNTLKFVFIVPFLYLLLVHFLSFIIEEFVYLKFLKKAKIKIKNKKVIGITGSCGKTSVKNIVYDLMENEFNVSKTPKSYNTRVGILKSINECLSPFDEYFICEYGVDRVKGMDKLLKVIKPNIAIITEIGNQHLLSFKSVENIFKEKIKIIEALDKYGIGIINNDNEYLKNYDYKSKSIIRYGIKNDSDIMAKNIELFSNRSEFDLYVKNKYISRITIPLLSIHGVENVLCAISVCLTLSYPLEKIVNNIKNITITEHRLESKVIDDIEVIDDAFNSNVKGFIDALNVLRISRKYKIIITPGIIEQGSNNKEVSYAIAKHIIESVDFVYLVTDNSKYIKEYFDSVDFVNYKTKESFIESFIDLKSIKEDKIVLIENDLPNIYLN